MQKKKLQTADEVQSLLDVEPWVQTYVGVCNDHTRATTSLGKSHFAAPSSPMMTDFGLI